MPQSAADRSELQLRKLCEYLKDLQEMIANQISQNTVTKHAVEKHGFQKHKDPA